jgi:adenine-specific DNA-methyltransferase
MFYTRANGMAIDAMRIQIERWENEGAIDTYERACLLAPMLYEACYTSNTSGVFKGFHNGWGGQTGTALYRILSKYQLRPAVFFDNGHDNRAYCMDALQLAGKLNQDGEDVTIAYLDPPYNQHPYGSNYHVLNTIALWDKPPLTEKIQGRNKAAIRDDWRTQRRSAYNYRGDAEKAYAELVATLDARYILTSYSTDGMIPLHRLVSACVQRGYTEFVLRKYKRYRVSSQRFSYKPLNVEFVLIVDTGRKHAGPNVDHICEMILKAEQAALDTHPETAA